MEIAIAAFFLVVGVIAGGVVSWQVAKRVTHRPRLILKLEQSAHIDPIGIDHKIQLAFDGSEIMDLTVYSLTIGNRGSRDISAPVTGWQEIQPIHLDFYGSKLLTTRQDSKSPSDAQVTPKISRDGTRLSIGIQRLKAGTECTMQVTATRDVSSDAPSNVVAMFPGTIPDVDVVPQGLLL